jgi:hypothetical protein
MAKNNSDLTHGMQGNLLGLTFVRSRTYDEHVRAPRGTYKEAVLNEAMQQSKERLKKSNALTKLIFDAVRDDHKDGTLWSRMLSAMRKQLKAGLPADVHCFTGIECNKEHQLDKLLYDQHYSIDAVIENNILHIKTHLKQHPKWRKVKYIHCYQPSFTILFPDFDNGHNHKIVVEGPVNLITSNPKPFSTEVTIPSGATRYMLFMTLTGGGKSGIKNEPHLKGMRVVKTGEI